MINVIAKVTAQTAHTETVKSALQAVLELVRSEEGCSSYDLHQDIKDKNIFFFYESWDTLHQLEEHRLKPHMVELGHQIKDLLEKHMEVNLMEKL